MADGRSLWYVSPEAQDEREVRLQQQALRVFSQERKAWYFHGKNTMALRSTDPHTYTGLYSGGSGSTNTKVADPIRDPIMRRDIEQADGAHILERLRATLDHNIGWSRNTYGVSDPVPAIAVFQLPDYEESLFREGFRYPDDADPLGLLPYFPTHSLHPVSLQRAIILHARPGEDMLTFRERSVETILNEIETRLIV